MIIYDKNGNERFSNVEKFTYNDTFMGENFLNMDINSDIPIPFDVGDYCIFRNDRFELNYKPSVEKTSSRNSSGDAFKYSSIKMNSIADELTRCPFSDIVPSDYNVVWTGLTNFTFYAKTADMLGRRIQTCLDEMYAYQTSRLKILSGVTSNGTITITLNGNNIDIPVTTSYNTPSLLASYISGLSFNGYNLIYISGNDYLDFKATTKGTGLPPSIIFGTTGSTGNINEIVKGNSWTVIVNKDNLVDYNKSVCNILQDDGQYRSSNGNLPIDSYMSFNNKTCSEALAELYNTFYVTYIIRGRTITVAPVGNLVGHTFGYGSDGGLLSLEQQTKQDSLLITRLSCFGSTRNISTKYYANLTGNAKATINTNAESFQTDRFTFKSGASSAGSLNFTLNGDTYIVNGITTSHNTDEKIASYVYSNSSVFSDKWSLKLYNIQKKIRLTFTKNREVQSLCSVNFVFGSYYFYPSATFFNSDTGLSDFAKDICSSLDDEQFNHCGWSKSHIEGTSYIEFTCNIGGIQETPNIYFHHQELSNTLSLLVTVKTEGISYIDFTKKTAIRCSSPSFNGNSTGVTATTETISYGQISYAELSDNTGYYFSLDFQAGASIYKKTGSINGIPILIDGKTTYQVKFKIGIYEVSGYIVLENYLVTGFVYNTETNYNNFISLLSSNPTIYITEGVYLDMLSSEYVNYSTTLSNNLAVTHLMLPNFPLVESNPNNIFIDSDNITKYGIRKAVVFFDGSDTQHPEIYPTIKDMTAKEVEDAGMSLSLDSNEGSDLTKIRLDEIKDCENPTDDGYIPTSIDSSYPGTTWFYLYIKDLGFDLSAMTGDNKYYYATTENMEVSMISGDCTGRTFKVTKIEKDTSLGYLRYKLTCDRYQDTNINKQYPNSDYKIEEGDIFVLLNIKLPQVYVLASSQKLLAYGNAYISKNDETKFQYVPKLAPKWMYEHSNGVDGIADTIHAGDLFDFSDTDLDVSGKVFIKTLTINVGTEQIPTYDITLDDEVESTTYQKIQNNIDNIMNQSSGSNSSSGTSSQTDLSNKYISKQNDDSTPYSLGVGKDLKVGGGINTSGNSVVEGDSSVVGKQTVGGDNNVIGNSDIGGDNTIGGNQNITGEIISKNFNAENKVGFAVKKKDDNHYKLSITDLEIWGKAIFNSLEVRRLVSVGGNYMFSPANGTILTVQEFDTYYRCYLLADDGTTATENGFNVNDNVLCETFNIKEGVYENVSNKRYWRTIVSVSNASEILYDKGLVYWGQVDADHLVYDSDGNPITYISESPLYEGKKYYYIDLSKTLCEAGSDIPSAGDEIATFGNTTDVDRQNSIYITSVGDDAPAIKFYKGVNSFDLTNKKPILISPDRFEVLSDIFTLRTSNGRTISIANYKGVWTEGTVAYYGEQYSYDGRIWECVNKTYGITTAPFLGEDWNIVVDKGEKGDTGNDGIAGKDGVGISSTTITYQIGDSGTTAPTGTWSSTVPTAIPGKYLWTRTVWTYTDNTNETGYSVSKYGEKGDTGNDGIAGKDGVGISSTTITYQIGDSGTTAPTGTWSSTVPTAIPGKYLWTRTVWTYTDNTNETGYSVSKYGEKGDTGSSVYLLDLTNENSSVTCDKSGNVIGTLQDTTAHLYYGSSIVSGVVYSAVFEGCSGSINANTGIVTMSGLSSNTGTVTIIATHSSGYLTAIYTITKVYAGADGSNAVTYYIIPSVSSIQKDNDTLTPSTITCSKYKQIGGHTPVITTEKTLKYKQSDDTSETTYSGSITISSTATYIDFILYDTDGTTILDKERIPVIQNGISVSTVDVEYAQNQSSTNAPTSGWQTTAPTWQNGYYIWTRTIIQMSDGSESTTESVCISGGKGIKSIVEYYYKSSSSTNLVGGSWQKTAPTWQNGYYIWTKSIITFTDNSTSETTPINATGNNGNDGINGTGAWNIVMSCSSIIFTQALDKSINISGNKSYFSLFYQGVLDTIDHIEIITQNNCSASILQDTSGYYLQINSISLDTNNNYYTNGYVVINVGKNGIHTENVRFNWALNALGTFKEQIINDTDTRYASKTEFNSLSNNTVTKTVFESTITQTSKSILAEVNSKEYIQTFGLTVYGNVIKDNYYKFSISQSGDFAAICSILTGLIIGNKYVIKITIKNIDCVDGATLDNYISTYPPSLSLYGDTEDYQVTDYNEGGDIYIEFIATSNIIYAGLITGSEGWTNNTGGYCNIDIQNISLFSEDMFNSLLATGINIQLHKIIATSDSFLIKDNSGNVNTVFETVNGFPMVRSKIIQADKIVATKIKTSDFGTRTEVINDMISQYNDLGELAVRIHGGSLNTSSGEVPIGSIAPRVIDRTINASNGLIQEFDISLTANDTFEVTSLMNTIKVYDSDSILNVPIDCAITCNNVKSIGYELYVSDIAGDNMSGAYIFSENPSTGTLNLTKGMSGTVVLASSIARTGCKIYVHFIIEFNNSSGSLVIRNTNLEDGNESIFNVKIKYGGNVTEIAKDGFLTSFGNYGFKISSSGIQKSVDGGTTWNPI